MTGIEATGEFVTGALMAGAIERTSGERHEHSEAHALCLNCGTALVGDYCHRCGQPEHIHRSLSAIWHDLAHGVFHFEGQVWNTLPMLVWRPGDLTRRFIHGERARFVSPMALFLFSVFLMFALFSAIGAHFEVPENKPPTEAAQAIARAQMPRAKAELARLIAARAAATTPEAKEALTQKIEKAREDINGLNEITVWKPGRDTNLKTGWPRLDAGLRHANENPNLTLYKIQSSAYKYSWALIPLSVPFLWLLYAWRPQYKLYDHAVFVTYSLSFMSLMVIVLTLLGTVGVSSNVIAPAAMIIPPLHIYRQLRGAYGTRPFRAILRTIALIVFCGMTLLAFLAMLLALGVLG
ncbi:DUF3667 domain-containing protein [Sphingomonas tabacisoli]|uniref:DUF3667 domain-containing protein n=1 Tax=Sphingomonas tabacisoli TaxID=2249466 RepID=A0ABW4I6W2_9SPHN